MAHTTTGLHKSRLRPAANNPREVAFAEQWKREHESDDLLSLILRVPCDRHDPQCIDPHDPGNAYMRAPLGITTERDRMVAATVIQWLGSNCGLSMITEALKRCGYSVLWPDDKKVSIHCIHCGEPVVDRVNGIQLSGDLGQCAACHYVEWGTIPGGCTVDLPPEEDVDGQSKKGGA